MKRTLAKDVWNFIRVFSRFNPLALKSFNTLERRTLENLPVPILHWKVKKLRSGKVLTGSGKSFPERLYGDKRKYEVMEVWTRISLADMIRFHVGLHPERESEFMTEGKIDYSKVSIILTCDGIPCGKSSTDSLYVTAMKVNKCKNMYILNTRIAKRYCPKKLDEFAHPLRECKDLGVRLKKFLGDAPVRSMFKRLKGHAGRYSCEVCSGEGETLKRGITWPASTMHSRKRSHLSWLKCVRKLERRQRRDPRYNNVKGIMGRSPLLDVPEFDIVKDAPTDPLHRDHLGITRNTWKIMTNQKTGCQKLNKTDQQFTNHVSGKYTKVRLPREFSHCARPVDVAVFKGHEWKSLLLTAFPAIADAAELHYGQAVGRWWTIYAFLYRVYVAPGRFYYQFSRSYLESLHEELYEIYEDQFGEENCKFNVHSYCHMPDNRASGRQHEISTEDFESAYGIIQQCYTPGTRSIGVQILRKMMMRLIGHDSCKHSLRMHKFKKGKKFDNSLLCDDQWGFYKVVKVDGDQVAVKKINTTAWRSKHYPELPFEKVGVVSYLSDSESEVTMRKSFFKGKAAMYDAELLMGIYWDALYS